MYCVSEVVGVVLLSPLNCLIVSVNETLLKTGMNGSNWPC